MSDDDILGIIEVPLYAFKFPPDTGREEDETAVDTLTSLFRRVPCKPGEWHNHIKGRLNGPLQDLLRRMGYSPDVLRRTVRTRKYPRVGGLRDCIVCLDGRQRITAARKVLGEDYWWPVKLYARPHADRISYETRDADGEIYWGIREHALGRGHASLQSLYTALTPSKEKILRLLLKRTRNDAGELEVPHKAIVDALDSVFSFPAFRKQFRLGNMLKILALRCPEPVSYSIRRIAEVWHGIVGSDHFIVDYKTVVKLQRRVPSNIEDKIYIEHMMDAGLIFSNVYDTVARARIKRTLLSLDLVLPSLETFHENVVFFSLGVKSIRKHILDDALRPASFGRNAVKGQETMYKLVRQHWKAPAPRIETGHEVFQPGPELTVPSVFMLLLLSALRRFPYLTQDTPIQDKRNGSDIFVAGEHAGSIVSFQNVARNLGLQASKLEQGSEQTPSSFAVHGAFSNYKTLDEKYKLVAERNGMVDEIGREALETSGSSGRLVAALDTSVRKKAWLSGKPSLRNFLYLQNTAFLTTLEKADATYDITPTFIMYDFLRAFFEMPAPGQSYTTSLEVPDTPMAGTDNEMGPSGAYDAPRSNPDIERGNTQAQDTAKEFEKGTLDRSREKNDVGERVQPQRSVTPRVEIPAPGPAEAVAETLPRPLIPVPGSAVIVGETPPRPSIPVPGSAEAVAETLPRPLIPVPGSAVVVGETPPQPLIPVPGSAVVVGETPPRPVIPVPGPAEAVGETPPRPLIPVPGSAEAVAETLPRPLIPIPGSAVVVGETLPRPLIPVPSSAVVVGETPPRPLIPAPGPAEVDDETPPRPLIPVPGLSPALPSQSQTPREAPPRAVIPTPDPSLTALPNQNQAPRRPVLEPGRSYVIESSDKTQPRVIIIGSDLADQIEFLSGTRPNPPIARQHGQSDRAVFLPDPSTTSQHETPPQGAVLAPGRSLTDRTTQSQTLVTFSQTRLGDEFNDVEN